MRHSRGVNSTAQQARRGIDTAGMTVRGIIWVYYSPNEIWCNSIMVATLSNQNAVALNGIDQPMFIVYAARPKASKVMLERLWLADSIKRRTLYVAQQRIHALERGLIIDLPEQVVFPRLIRKLNRHRVSTRAMYRLARLDFQLIPSGV